MSGRLADILAPDLRCVFVGINPGLKSAEAGFHFANPRNDFWRLLAGAGLTSRLLEPSQQDELLANGLGLTNAARRVTRGSGELRRTDFADAARRLGAVARDLHPGAFAFVGKQAYAGAFGERPDHGLQARELEGRCGGSGSWPYCWISPEADGSKLILKPNERRGAQARWQSFGAGRLARRSTTSRSRARRSRLRSCTGWAGSRVLPRG
jgi:G:T/U-mismatch repair DNA glycosylase